MLALAEKSLVVVEDEEHARRIAAAIFGRNVSDGTGVHGNCNRGEGVVGVSDQSNGVRGRGERAGYRVAHWPSQ